METSRARGLGLIAAGVATLLWAGNFVAGKIAAGTADAPRIDPLLIASIRIFCAAAFFPLFLPREERRTLWRPATWRAVLPLALSGIVANQFLFAAGIKWTTPSHSALVHALIPVFVLIIGWVFVREGAGPIRIVGMVLAIAGSAYVALSAPEAERHRTLFGDLLTLGGALSFAVYMVLGRRLLERMGSYHAVTTAFVLSAPFSIPFFAVAAARQDWNGVPSDAWIALAYMIVAATFVCYTLHMFALSKIGPLRVAVFTNLQPILATAIAQLFGEDRVTLPFVAAGAVVIAGVAMVQFAKR
jgi:drug/metabolite transporter (DMT)-like permease